MYVNQVYYDTMTRRFGVLGDLMATDAEEGTSTPDAVWGARLWLLDSGLAGPFVFSDYTIHYPFYVPRFTDMVVAAYRAGS